MKRDIHGRFVKPFNWKPVKWSAAVIGLVFFWAVSVWTTVLVVGGPVDRDEPIVVFVDNNGPKYAEGVRKGSKDTISIFAQLTLLGHPWDHEEIQKRLLELNPELDAQ